MKGKIIPNTQKMITKIKSTAKSQKTKSKKKSNKWQKDAKRPQRSN